MTFHSRNTDSLPWGLWVFPAFALVWAGSWLVSRGLVDFGTCGLKQLLGIPCLSCGATRATLLLLGGAPFAALTMQPLVILGYGLLATWGIVSGNRRDRPHPRGLSDSTGIDVSEGRRGRAAAGQLVLSGRRRHLNYPSSDRMRSQKVDSMNSTSHGSRSTDC